MKHSLQPTNTGSNDHPNDIDGCFDCDFDRLESGELELEMNFLDPQNVWTWDYVMRKPYGGRWNWLRIGESFEKDNGRKALLVMATGNGKTRTVNALCDLLVRCNWAKRILLPANRVALVNHSAGVFKKFLPDASAVNLVTEKNSEGRVYVSTHPTMIRPVDDTKGGPRRFGVGHFDLIVIEEAHRSVFQKH